ncbi:olfactory receptor 8B8-like [Pyxicephalus adspersus]
MFGNVIIVTVIGLNHHLHVPMYFFLCNLASLDVCYTSVTTPNLLHIFITGNNRISFTGCFVQLYFFLAFASAEYFLLTAMSYDRYVAICKPLHYPLVINRQSSVKMVCGSWLIGFVGALPLVIFISGLDFGSTNEVNHYFCDMIPLLKLSCSDTSFTEVIMFSEGVFLAMTCFMLTLTSYCFIISTILRIHTSEGRRKAFSTCSSHLSIVILFYVVIFCLYMKPPSTSSLNQSKVMSVLFTQVVPMLNPIIYSLRNKDVKEAIGKTKNKAFWCSTDNC